MGRYLRLSLNAKYKTEKELERINGELIEKYGAVSLLEDMPVVFPTQAFAESEAEYINTSEEGKSQCPYITRPITWQKLIGCHPEMFDIGHIQIKISACSETEAKTARAVCLWAEENPEKIKKNRSDNYDRETIFSYTRFYFEDKEQ